MDVAAGGTSLRVEADPCDSCLTFSVRHVKTNEREALRFYIQVVTHRNGRQEGAGTLTF